MNEIISTVTKMYNAKTPTKKAKIIFKDFRSAYNVDQQEETFTFNSYQVVDDKNKDYVFIENHIRTLSKDELNNIRSLISVSSKNYSDIKNEEILKGVSHIINEEGIFGLKSSEIIIR